MEYCLNMDWFRYQDNSEYRYIMHGSRKVHQVGGMINVSCLRTQRNDAGEARTGGPTVSSQSLYH